MEAIDVCQQESQVSRTVMKVADSVSEMRIRRSIMPRRPLDILCFLLIVVFLPIIFIFEIIVVLPAFHEHGGFWHTFTFLIAMFLIFNIKGNMLACMMIDTSYGNSIVRQRSGTCVVGSAGWRWCEWCQRLAPPRSWHCKVCRSCILKRDHHCFFTGCCIGHRNHRYFMMFIFHLAIGSTYALVYNSLFLWMLSGTVYHSWFTLLKMCCPMLMLVSGSLDNNLYLVFYSLNVLAVVYSAVLSVYHASTVLQGGVSHERDKGYHYNSGRRRNLRDVFGDRMYLVWLSPFVKSPLPHNGIDFTVPKHHTN